MSSTPVNPTSNTLPGPPGNDARVQLTLSVAPDGQIVWWISSGLGNMLTRGMKRELVATLDHFLEDFVRTRG